MIQSNASPSSFAAAYLVVAESLALPSLTAPLLRRAQVRLRETADTGNRCVFFVGPDALHRAVPGRPGVPPLPMGERNLIPHLARATARVAPTSTCLKPDGRVRTPAPTRHIQKLSFFVGAGPRPAHGRGKPLPYESQEGFPNMGRGAPWGSRQNTYREHLLNQARRCCGTAPAAIFE